MGSSGTDHDVKGADAGAVRVYQYEGVGASGDWVQVGSDLMGEDGSDGFGTGEFDSHS